MINRPPGRTSLMHWSKNTSDVGYMLDDLHGEHDIKLISGPRQRFNRVTSIVNRNVGSLRVTLGHVDCGPSRIHARYFSAELRKRFA